MKRPLIAGNWKMNKTGSETKAFFDQLLDKIQRDDVDTLICPPFTSLCAALEAVKGSTVQIGAQNMHFEDGGAYTGEVTAQMLTELGVSYVIIGHSERRAMFNETDETVNKKVKKALSAGLKPVMCVGESLEERESGKMEAVITAQIEQDLDGVAEDDNLVIAYEPIWAIGTGKTASKEQAQEVCGLIRSLLTKKYSEAFAQSVRILYGGSVNAANIDELMAMPDIDGALVGGASLKEDFARLVQFETK